MKFNVGIKSISISQEAKKVFEDLDTIRPKHISFSLMLAITADEYIKQHKRGLVKLDEFSTENISAATPNFFSPVENWIGYLSTVDSSEKIRIKERLIQLQNMMDGARL
tara:strand:- start:9696 stop:10022 length:327 start_codon:yes stop_codon:yes gene_type:complete